MDKNTITYMHQLDLMLRCSHCCSSKIKALFPIISSPPQCKPGILSCLQVSEPTRCHILSTIQAKFPWLLLLCPA